jgi:threonylcarbamoyladenosine tRNA methylthiotransferase MtaB
MKIYLDSIGCRLNQSEIEIYARQFRAAGHKLVPTAGEADLTVINTCTVTNAADSDSRGKIRQVVRAGANQVVVTGCWSTLNPDIAAQIPGVSQVIPNADKAHLVQNVLQIPQENYDLEPLVREPIPGARLRTRAFIKVQDGCNNRCTFCVTTIARGPGKSRSITDILNDINAELTSDKAGENAAKEIVLTGVHLGSWGQDISETQNISYLVQTILKETDVPRLRLSSLEPWDLDEYFFSLWENPRLCRHLHLPLQSGSATVLRRMARKTTPEAYAKLVEAARKVCPYMAITTDLIAGFPGETDREFFENVEYIREMSFAGGHVFTYSARRGTSAAEMPNQVPFKLRKMRNAELRKVLTDSGQNYQRRFINQTIPVLWETVTQMDSSSWQLRGLTDNYLRVNAQATSNFWNQITPVYLTEIGENGLDGEIQESKHKSHGSKLHIL